MNVTLSPGWLSHLTSFQIRAGDPASLVCDHQYQGAASIYPRIVCTSQANLLPELSPGMGQKFDGHWTIQPRDELPWPGWTTKTRQRGDYVRPLQLGSPRAKPVRVLPDNTSNTGYDLLVGFGQRLPPDFNVNRVPSTKDVMHYEQQACNPWDLGEHHFLQHPFIAGGPLVTIPSTRVKHGAELNLKRCQLCQWVYGRVIK